MIEFFVPSTPVAQGRPRFSTHGGFVKAYDPAKSRDYKSWVRNCALDVMAVLSVEPYQRDIPLCIRLEIGLTRPKTKPKRYVVPTTKPDLDNYYKSITDALNSICYHDDSQISHATIVKRYAERPGVLILIWEDKL